jgi:hypothetical protein
MRSASEKTPGLCVAAFRMMRLYRRTEQIAERRTDCRNFGAANPPEARNRLASS